MDILKILVNTLKHIGIFDDEEILLLI